MADPTIADVMQAYARGAVAYARRHLDVTLDFSERSLEDVDRVLAEYSRGELILPDNLSDTEREDLWVFCKMIGGYVGEVIIRNIGGQWHTKDLGGGAEEIRLKTSRAEGSPPDAVWRALTEPYKPIVSYYRALRMVLGHGEESTECGIRTVRLPPLCDQPRVQAGSGKRPWWKFW